MSLSLKKKIDSKKANIIVMGLGYVGLPLAVSFAAKGFSVFGLDKDEDRVRRVQDAISYILDVPTARLRQVVKKKKLMASTDFSIVRHADVIIICVPTPLKRKYTPDISFIVNAVRTIRQYIKRDTLVVLESTTYPGTTKELIAPELEKSGMRVGQHLFLSFSPERIDPGNKKYPVTEIPKVVGGMTEQSGILTEALYKKIIKKVHRVSSAEAAEMTKLLENSFRIINIGWINEVAIMSHKLGIDVWEVIDAAKTKPFGFMPFYPGLGVGGHCIPDDPLYLYWKAKQFGFSSKYIKLSADTNSSMPTYAVERLRDILQKDKKSLKRSRVLVLGATYKKDVKDLRKSPSLTLIELLQRKCQRVDYYDPIIPYLEFSTIHMHSIAFNSRNIASYDCVIIATDHTAVDYGLVLKKAKRIFDLKNIYCGAKNKKIIKL